MPKKPQVPELKILLDTNVLYTQAAHDLIKPEIAELIAEHSSYPDHKITWHLPEMVVFERQYQMEKIAQQLLPSLEKTGRLLGTNLGFTPQILKDRVADAIKTQLQKFKFCVVPVDVSSVDWKKVMNDAVFRRPPFDSGDKEKGFRDAMIVESMRHLVKVSPATPTICRVVLVTEDKLLIEAASAATGNATNVRILSDVEELRGLISTLVSQVGEVFVEAIQPKAQALFFVKEDKTTLYYKEEIRSQIKNGFTAELAVLPDGVTETELGTWYVGNPRFVKKAGQRIFWASRVEATFKGLRSEQTQLSLKDAVGSNTNTPAPNPLVQLAGLLRTPEKIAVGDFGNVFEIDWSVTLGQNKKFSTPKIEAIRFVELRTRSKQQS